MTWDSAKKLPRLVNEKGWCGHKDWRLPTRDELATLLVLASHRPAVQVLHIWTDVFPDIPADGYSVWTSSPYACNGSNVRYYGGGIPQVFSDGTIGNSDKVEKLLNWNAT